jgi:predicted  nucleic acid-binding Zn-ribbon protein
MATVLGTLKELHQLLEELADVREQLERGPKQLQNREAELAKKEQTLRAEREAVRRMRIEADEKELSLKSSEQRVRDLKLKLNLVKTNKEFSALQDEIRTLQEANGRVEDEILGLITEHESRTAQIRELEQQLREDQAEFEKLKETLEYRMGKLSGRVAVIENQIAEFEQRLEPPTLAEYRRLLKVKGRRALASCEDGTCSACFTEQTPQTCSELALGKVVHCTTCGSMLYLP